ncbi:MAG: glycosyltransferase family 4 protein [Chloroflexi bacterium]|nr:glycosyltransferase family 4 protein [Chloroflexota bacterium]
MPGHPEYCPVRLCYFADPQSVHTKRWLMFFSQRGHEIHLVGSRPPDTDWPSDWHFHFLPPDFPGMVPQFIWAISNYVHGHKVVVATHWWWTLYCMKRLILKIAPDLVHVHYICGHNIHTLLCGFHPIVATAWGSDIYVTPKRYTRLETYLLRHALQEADLVTCDAEDLRRQTIVCGARPESTVLIQWGVDPVEFRPGLDTTSVREKWNIARRWPVLLSPRSLRPSYNIEVILHALDRLRGYYPEIVLLQLGKPEEDDEYGVHLTRLVHELGLERHLRWLNYVPEVELPLLYNVADVTLSVPASDSTPVSMLEAMACGVPLVMTDLLSIREWITPGVNGYLISVRDVEAIVQATVDILTAGEEWRQTAAQHSRELIHKRANRAEQLGRMEERYLSLASHTNNDHRGKSQRISSIRLAAELARLYG